MNRYSWTLFLLLLPAIALNGQDKKDKKPKSYPDRCVPKFAKQDTKQDSKTENNEVVIKPGEKSTGYPPLISFQVLESGEVVNAKVKRSSGFASVDNHALEGIKQMKLNERPGCGVVESEAVIDIHWR